MLKAPVIGKHSFGDRVDVSIFKPSFLPGEARVVDDTLYLTYNTTDSPFKRIATLSRGVLHPIRLSHDYYEITFENGNRLISAVPPRGPRDWYQLEAGKAVSIPVPPGQFIGVPPHVLADGDSCAEGMDGSASALDEIRAQRRVSILTQSAFFRTTKGVTGRVDHAYCDHFHGKNYVTMEAAGLIVRLDGAEAAILGAGRIEAANERHMVILAGDSMVDLDARPDP